MISDQPCPKCGAPARPGLLGLCPKCLLGEAFTPLILPDSESDGASTEPAASGNPIAAGRRFGNYTLLNDIGSGGNGIVWLARQLKPVRNVALKMLLFGRSAGSNERARFVREAEAVARLQHPNIVPIFEVGEHDGLPFFSMEYIEGPTLAALSEQRPLTATVAATYIKQISEAVHFAHQNGIVHRDIKPSNILLDLHDRPRLADFGIAHQLGTESDLTKTGNALGSLQYAPPEQVGGRTKEIGILSDVYSLGATLYRLLTGRPPFVGDTAEVVFAQVLKDEPIPPRVLNRSVPRDLETICLKCLEKNPARRYASAQALAVDLGRFLQGETVEARPIGPTEQAWRSCKKRPVAASSIIGLIVALALGGLFLQARTNEAIARRNAELRQFMLNNQYVQLTERQSGWYGLVSNALPNGDTPEMRSELRDRMAGSLIGVDAFPERALTNVNAVGLWRVPGSTTILVTGQEKDSIGLDQAVFKAWNPELNQTQTYSIQNTSTWAFGWASNQIPVQLVWDISNRLTYALWNLATGQRWREISLPPEAQPDPSTALSEKTKFDLSFDGRWLALAQPVSGRQGILCVADMHAGRIVFQTNFTYAASVSALSVSQNGEFLAIGMKEGYVVVWSLGSGRQWRPLQDNSAQIKSLCFHRESRSDIDDTETSRWLLAAVDAGDSVSVWDLKTLHPRVRLLARAGGVAEFNADGSTLVLGGRRVELWDFATGKRLLGIDAGEEQAGLAFADDQRRLFVADDRRDGIAVWNIDPGRGTLTLRGLNRNVSELCISDDGRRLAGYSRGHEVAVWNLTDGRLIHVWEVPHELKGREAALAFNHDGSELAFASERTVKWWHVDSGRLLFKRWYLRPGIDNMLGFAKNDGTNSLLVFRQETILPRVVPYPEADPVKFPRTCRLYRLTADSTNAHLLLDLTNFNRIAKSIIGSGDGRHFVVDGNCATTDRTNRVLLCIDGLAGRPRWTRPLGVGHPAGEGLRIDSSKRTLIVTDTPDSLAIAVDLATGVSTPWPASTYPLALGPYGTDRRQWVIWSQTGHGGLQFFEGTHSRPAVSLGPNLALAPSKASSRRSELEPVRDTQPIFSPDGQVLAVGQPDGSIIVFRIPEIRSHLGGLGLGW